MNFTVIFTTQLFVCQCSNVATFGSNHGSNLMRMCGIGTHDAQCQESITMGHKLLPGSGAAHNNLMRCATPHTTSHRSHRSTCNHWLFELGRVCFTQHRISELTHRSTRVLIMNFTRERSSYRLKYCAYVLFRSKQSHSGLFGWCWKNTNYLVWKDTP